jgi:hypothetical protein
MLDHARVLFVLAGCVLQPEGSECINAFVALDGAFSSNGSGASAACMLSCEESFILGRMNCASSVKMINSSHVVVFPAHCFSTCSIRHGRFESTLLASAAAVFKRCTNAKPALRYFFHPSQGSIDIKGLFHANIESMKPVANSTQCCFLVVYGSCVGFSHAAAACHFGAAAVFCTSLANILNSRLAKVRPYF